MASGDEIQPADLTINVKDILPDILTEQKTMREYNHDIVMHYMNKFENNTKMVADILDIGQTTVYRMLKEMEQDETDAD